MWVISCIDIVLTPAGDSKIIVSFKKSNKLLFNIFGHTLVFSSIQFFFLLKYQNITLSNITKKVLKKYDVQYYQHVQLEVASIEYHCE